MTVRELRLELEELPDDLLVVVEGRDDFTTITQADVDLDTWRRENVVVLR